MTTPRYAYFNTRVSLLAARLFGNATLETLIDQPQTPFDPTTGIPGLDDFMAREGVSSAPVEQALTTTILAELQVLLRPLQGPDRRFLHFCTHWFELGNLKTLLRGKLGGLGDAEVRQYLTDTAPFVSLPIEELLRSEDPAEMLRRLEATHYEDIARQARQTYAERKDPFFLDASIDRRYFVALHHRANELGDDQRAPVQRLVGCMIDRFNLLWLLRYRLSYNISPAETYYLLIPVGHALTSEHLTALVQMGSLGEVLAALPEPLRPVFEGAETLTEVENRMEQRTRGVMAATLGDNLHPMARAFAYAVLRDMELRQLLAVVKGRRLGFDPALTRFAASLTVH